ncbi:MAG: DegT/DnrJ/EryC1/StrS family aminotransferase [Candidatus Omnitrophota bacterium]
MNKRRKISIAVPYIGKKEIEAVKKPLLSGWLTQGACVADFEKEFAKIHGIGYAVATTSCTTALHLALVALGVGAQDEVIVPSFTWIATANAVEYTGARPVFCDIDPDTYNISVKDMETLITSRTKAVIPVHLFGLCADMHKIIAICKQHKLYIVEDAACAIGASICGKKAGSFGDIGCFSFHPRKIVTTGEGGMCTTSSRELMERLVSLRNHGASISEEKRCLGDKPYIMPDFKILGYNYRMTDLQGAIGLAQLSRLESFIRQRQKWAVWYKKALKDIKWLIMPHLPKGFQHSYQSFVCYVDESKSPMPRDEIMERLFLKGLNTRAGTMAIHMQDYYAKKYNIGPDVFSISRDCYLHSLAIPLHNRMTAGDYKYVVSALKGI